jgi:hypothetical protein
MVGRIARTCGKYAITLIGWHVREKYTGFLPLIGAVAGLLVGSALVLTWRLAHNHVSASTETPAHR